jgi:hypothetical protein
MDLHRTWARALPALAALLVLAAAALPAEAQSFGARAGASVDPDQFYFGGHLETPDLVENLRFRPNVEIGIGDDRTLIGLNFELAYHFRMQSQWHVYAGAGPALNIIDRESDTDAEGGFNILLGVEHRRGLFFEIKVGTIDSPEFKIGIGYVFGR